jgi:hypothetical protein
MKIKVELEEDDFSKLLEAIGIAYHRREHCGDSKGAKAYSELDKRVRSAVANAKHANKQDWLAIARKHGYAFPDKRMEDFVAELKAA